MVRWDPDSRGRLQRAAIELYAEQGFAETTVAAVAARAGVTERTYFRHFPDKREVLFAQESALQEVLVRAVDEQVTPGPDPHPWALALRAVIAVATALEPRHAELRHRELIVAAHPELREREQAKLGSWSAALRAALESHGVPAEDADLVAAGAVAVLDATARAWLARPEPTPLVAHLNQRVDRLGELLAGRA